MTSESSLRQTPLHQIHVDAGAHQTDFAGWDMPLRYSSHLAEHETVRTHVGLFDLSHMAQIFVTGAQAAQGLNRCFISPMDKLAVGRAKYSMLTNQDGGILDDLIVYRLAEDEYLVVANASNREVVVKEVTARCAEVDPAIQVRDETLQRAIIAVQGPSSVEVMGRAGFDVEQMRYYSVQPATINDAEVLVARTGYTGEDGFEIYCDADHAAALWQQLMDAGKEANIAPCGLACRDSLRLEAGMPLYGNELNADLTPMDVGMGRMVKFDHDFVGRDALADTEARYGLIGLKGEGRRAARAGSTVIINGEEVGEVTSGILSPTLGYPIALARVRVPAPEVDTEVEVNVRGKSQAMTVVQLPFYSRKK